MRLEICPLLQSPYAFSGGPQDTAVEQVSGTSIPCARGLYRDPLQALLTATHPAYSISMYTSFTGSRSKHTLRNMEVTGSISLLLANKALAKPSCNRKSFTYPINDGMEVTLLEANQHENWSSSVIVTLPTFSDAKFCEVKLHVTRHGSKDDVGKWLEKAVYNGADDPKSAASWSCSRSNTGFAKVGHAEYQWRDEL